MRNSFRKQAPDLVLSAKRSVWRMHDHAGENADAEFRKVRSLILEAADNTCAFCGLKSKKYQEVHHGDDDHKNNSPENLHCACPLCHQVFHLGLASMMDGGDLVYLPEFTQAEVNQLVLMLWLATTMDNTRDTDPKDSELRGLIQSRAKMIQSKLETRRGTVLLRVKQSLKDRGFPPDRLDKIKMSHLGPALFANLLMGLSDADYETRDILLGGLRLLPKPSRFVDQIAHWRKEQEVVMPIPSWYQIVPEDSIRKIVDIVGERISSLTSQEQ